MTNPIITPDYTKRFWLNVGVSDDTSACWEWKISRFKSGYGKTQISQKTERSHRVAYIIQNGNIPDGLHVLHTCDNRACCNPNHLFLGTQQDNMIDKVRKGKQIRGETHPLSKLLDEQIREIRDRYSKGGITHNELALEFGVCRRAIGKIINKKHWKHI
jgi:hypothetical protein